MTEIKEKEVFILKPYTPKELRTLYGVSRVTFNKWLEPFKKEMGAVLGRCYNVHQVRFLIEKLGFPEKLEL
jgi:hypothetical protein